ncbi:MAG: hypothetical protein ABI597_00670 [Gammaproteobacteria bacterium]
MKILKLFSLLMLSLVTCNSFAAQVVCNGNAAHTPYSAIDDLNRNLSRIPNMDKMVITAPVFVSSLGDDRSTEYHACVSVNSK